MSSPGRAEVGLVEAFNRNDLAAFKKAISRGEDVNKDIPVQDDDSKVTLLNTVAVHSNYLPFLKALLNAKGIDVNKKDAKGNTALHTAISSSQYRVAIELLCDSRVDVELVDQNGVTPLRNAINTQSGPAIFITRLLLMRGAKMTIDDYNSASDKKKEVLDSKAYHRMFGRVYFPCVSLFNWVMDNKPLSLGILAATAVCAYAVMNSGAITKMCPCAMKNILCSSQCRSL